MPGWSLWLLPPATANVNQRLETLIKTNLPALFPDKETPAFVPHVTLTSNIEPKDDVVEDPQRWLDGLKLDGVMPQIHFSSVVVGDTFVKKLFLRCDKDEGLLELAVRSRAYGVENGSRSAAEHWLGKQYDPHCSLLYGDFTVSEEEKNEATKQLAAAGVGFGMSSKGDTLDGWSGGRVWLVPTSKPISEWKSVAEKVL